MAQEANVDGAANEAEVGEKDVNDESSEEDEEAREGPGQGRIENKTRSASRNHRK